MAKPRSQPDRRMQFTLTDQFGRKFRTVVERDTMRPCAPLQPFGFTERLPVAEAYCTWPDPADHSRIHWDLDRLIEDTERAHEEYQDTLRKRAAQMHPEDAGAVLLANHDEALHALVGRPPKSVEPYLAMRAGNKYCLGLTDKMPDWARPFFIVEDTRNARSYADRFPDVEDATETTPIVDDEVAPVRTPRSHHKSDQKRTTEPSSQSAAL